MRPGFFLQSIRSSSTPQWRIGVLWRTPQAESDCGSWNIFRPQSSSQAESFQLSLSSLYVTTCLLWVTFLGLCILTELLVAIHHMRAVVRLSFGPPLEQLEKGTRLALAISHGLRPQYFDLYLTFFFQPGLDGIERVLRQAHEHLSTVRNFENCYCLGLLRISIGCYLHWVGLYRRDIFTIWARTWLRTAWPAYLKLLYKGLQMRWRVRSGNLDCLSPWSESRKPLRIFSSGWCQNAGHVVVVAFLVYGQCAL